MAILYPTSLDSFSDKEDGEVLTAAYINDMCDAIEQLQARVGVSSEELIQEDNRVLFYMDTAPTGWTLSTANDKLVYVTKGSAAGGETGGAVHSTGSWTQPDHSHSGSTGNAGSHKHKWYVSKGDGEDDRTYNSNGNPVDIDPIVKEGSGSPGSYYFIGVDAVNYDNTERALRDSYTNNVSNHNHSVSINGNAPSSTWRPSAYCFILAKKSAYPLSS